jgi:hypothetical protein
MALLQELLTRDTHKANKYREQIREYNSVIVFRLMGSEITLPSGNGPYSSWTHGQIYHSVSMVYPNKANKQGYGQLHILNSAKTTKWLEN